MPKITVNIRPKKRVSINFKGIKIVEGEGGSGCVNVHNIKPGQLIRVSAVDEAGNPTAWEPVPFMYEDVQKTILFPEQELNGFVDFGLGVWHTAQTDITGVGTQLTVGTEYAVIWDSVTYKTVCKELYGYPYIGNASIADEVFEDTLENSGEPFFLINTPPAPTGIGIDWLTKQTEPSHMVGVSTTAISTISIPPKFLGGSDTTEASALQVENGKAKWSRIKVQIDEEPSYWTEEDWNLCEKIFYSGGIVTTLDGLGNTVVVVFVNHNFLACLHGNVVDQYTRYDGVTSHYDAFALSTTEVGLSMITTLESGCQNISGEVLKYASRIMLKSSTAGSSKRFKIMVDDTGAITATEVT